MTRDLAKYFERVVGLDNSPGMIDAANAILRDEGGLEGRVRFGVCPAEGIDVEGALEEGSVDVITSAVAVSVSSYSHKSVDHIFGVTSFPIDMKGKE